MDSTDTKPDGDEPSSPTIPSDDHNNNLNSTSSKNQVLNSSAEETLPPTTGSNTNDAETHSNIIIPNPDLDDQLEFLKINEHRWDQGVLIFQVLYASSQGNVSLDVPFNTLKKDKPYKVACYIRLYITEPRRGDRPLTDWAIKTIKEDDTIA